jgi:hypothetical protein
MHGRFSTNLRPFDSYGFCIVAYRGVDLHCVDPERPVAIDRDHLPAGKSEGSGGDVLAIAVTAYAQRLSTSPQPKPWIPRRLALDAAGQKCCFYNQYRWAAPGRIRSGTTEGSKRRIWAILPRRFEFDSGSRGGQKTLLVEGGFVVLGFRSDFETRDLLDGPVEGRSRREHCRRVGGTR